ncbi:hypothetical protein RUM44_003951 [Polyplax serrata]|uniref:Peptidase metallopeptidase domain-containing protein n=1 Tax=Polyplax serrata TaxID=468196 RepID=A0ABR1B1F7_POLSC
MWLLGLRHLTQPTWRGPVLMKPKLIFPLLLLWLCVALADSNSTRFTKAAIYLSKFGYLPPGYTDPSSVNEITMEEFSRAVSDFQWFFGLNVTGKLDSSTLIQMSKPRCSVPEKIHRRQKRYRYVDDNSFWPNVDLSYYFYNFSEQVGRRMQHKEFEMDIKLSFLYWSNVSDLTFKRTYNRKKADMILLWAKGEHECDRPFDGVGGELAHGFPPSFGGHVHFDDDEEWSTRVYHGTNLIQVATHEIGHAIGLEHSKIEDAIMYPTYNGYVPDFKLHHDDIIGIQSLYGKPFLPRWQKESRRRTNELCFIYYAIDTMFTDASQRMFVFIGAKYWEVNEKGIVNGYPKKITQNWPGAPTSMNAACNYKSMTLFFKGSKYWMYDKNKLVQGYPKSISKGFKGIPNNIDAAFVFKGNLYFFKDSFYWKYKASSSWVSTPKQKPITNWKYIPENLTAAFVDNQNNYIMLQGRQYYKLDPQTGNLDKDRNFPYPRNFRDWWLDCGGRPERKNHKL